MEELLIRSNPRLEGVFPEFVWGEVRISELRVGSLLKKLTSKTRNKINH